MPDGADSPAAGAGDGVLHVDPPLLPAQNPARSKSVETFRGHVDSHCSPRGCAPYLAFFRAGKKELEVVCRRVHHRCVGLRCNSQNFVGVGYSGSQTRMKTTRV